MDTIEKTQRRIRRKGRIRSKVHGTAALPRLAVFRSNTQITAQIIDDEKNHTLAAVTSKDQKGKTPLEKSVAAGAEIAKAAQEKKIKEVVFDRGGFKYVGNIKAFADAARKEGLAF